ncbi:hypothetical protein [Nostoc sp. LPT]|uniref:hypothetical protein n=1 Tax=Nostoc sp. LPT TaxID=2815387 RepID=UPI001E199694|nr:hypothetical protein [Nostoc sp. LPT]MBN4005584.1 hypothetical protein [Nostoc sp. LPT]
MNKRLLQTWQKFQQSFSIEESLNTTVKTGKAVLEAAEHLKAWTQYEVNRRRKTTSYSRRPNELANL